MKDKGKLWHDRMLNDSFLKLLDNRISASKNQGFDRACEFFMRCPATYFQTWLLISTSLCWNLKPIYSISWTLYRKWKIINHDWPKKQKNSWEPYCDIIFSCGRRLIHEQENTLLACYHCLFSWWVAPNKMQGHFWHLFLIHFCKLFLRAALYPVSFINSPRDGSNFPGEIMSALLLSIPQWDRFY